MIQCANHFNVTARIMALGESESRAFLVRQRVGRIAFSFGGSVDIKPLSRRSVSAPQHPVRDLRERNLRGSLVFCAIESCRRDMSPRRARQ